MVGAAEDVVGGLGRYDRVKAVVPAVDEGADLAWRSLTEVNVPQGPLDVR
jgi:hypothetical protein